MSATERAGFTPGPWKAYEGNFGTTAVTAEGAPDVVKWVGFDESERSLSEHRANARLIAAAPDLLAELRNIAEADPSTWDSEVRGQFREWAQSRARAAIRKAVGG